MLPWPDRAWIPDPNLLSGPDGPQDIRDKPVFCKISSADDVSRPGASHRQVVGAPVRRSDQFRAAFAVAIGIEAPHRLVFAISPDPLPILVALVGGHVDDGFDGTRLTGGFQHM